MSDRPPKAWVEKYVKAAALSKLADGRTTIAIQQRLYDRYLKLLREGQEKWPLVDFSSSTALAGLAQAVERWLREHPMAGPGSGW